METHGLLKTGCYLVTSALLGLDVALGLLGYPAMPHSFHDWLEGIKRSLELAFAIEMSAVLVAEILSKINHRQ